MIEHLKAEIGPDFMFWDVNVTRDDGTAFHKKIPLEEFAAIFSDATEKSITYRRLQLPKFCYDLAVSEDLHSFRIAFLVDGISEFPFVYANRLQNSEDGLATYMVPMPTLLFLCNVVKGNLAEAYVYAMNVPKEQVNNETILFNFPYCNVYSDGKICFGRNRFQDIKIADSSQIVEKFFSGVNNGDLFKERKIGNIDKCTLSEFLLMMEGKTEFPQGAMVRTSLKFGKTVDNYLVV